METYKKVTAMIEKEKETNLFKKDTILIKHNYLKNNSIDKKIANSILCATPIYFIEGIVLAAIVHSGASTLPISNLIVPGAIITSSLAGGVLVNSIINKKGQNQEIMNQLTNVDSEKEAEEELIRNEIELAKINNRELALKSRFINREYNNSDEPSIACLKKEYEDLNIKISNQLSDLDTLTTQNYLITRFGTYFNSANLATYLGAYPLVIAGTTLFASCAPLLAASINPTLLVNLIIPFIAGEICGIAYQADKVIRNRALFKKFNDELGKEKLSTNGFKLEFDGTAINQDKWKIADTISNIFRLVERSKEIEFYLAQDEAKNNSEEVKETTINHELEHIQLVNSVMDEPLVPKLKPKKKV